MKIVIAIVALILLGGCLHDKGTKVGHTFKDCDHVTASEREGFAKQTKDLSRDAAIKLVADAKGVTVEQAATCFK